MNRSTGDFLKELRLEKNLSQNQLASKLHISRSVIAKYETNEREPSYNNLLIYSNYFKISMTDLLAGERLKKKSKNTEELLNFLVNKINTFKTLVITLITILLIVTIGLLIYIAVLNYTSTKVYKVLTNDKNLTIKEGLLVKTKDRIYLTLQNNLDENEISDLKLYYMRGKDKVYILHTTNIQNIYFFVDLNNSEYIARKDIPDLLKNSYIELIHKNNKIDKVKVNYNFDYSNKKLEKDKTEKLDDVSPSAKSIDKSILYDVANKLIKENENKIFDIKLNKTEYKVSVMKDQIHFLYNTKNKNYKLIYLCIKDEEVLNLYQNGETIKLIYSFNITTGECRNESCENAKNDIILIKKILDKIEK